MLIFQALVVHMPNAKKLLAQVAVALLIPLILSLVPYLFVIQLGVDIALHFVIATSYLVFGILYLLGEKYLPAVLSLSIFTFLLGWWAWGLAILTLTVGVWLLLLYSEISRY